MKNKSKKAAMGGILLISCIASASVLAHGTDASWCAKNKSQLAGGSGSAGQCKYYQPGDTMGKTFRNCTWSQAGKENIKSCAVTQYCIIENQALIYQQGVAGLTCKTASTTGNAHVCMSQAGNAGAAGHWENQANGYICASGP